MPIKLVFLAFLDMSSGTSDALIFINILVFFVGLSLIVLCYLCDFFFLTLSSSFTCFHNHGNIVQTSSIHLLKGIVSRIDVIFDWSEKRRFFIGTCFIQKIYAPSSSLLQGKHLPFSPSPLRLNIVRLFVILSLIQLYRYTLYDCHI
jgi:hypothetical protein